MNSSMQRFVRTRERLFHRSKNLVLRHVVIAPATTIGGVEVPEVAFDVPEVSPEKGVTYNVGRNVQKRFNKAFRERGW